MSFRTASRLGLTAAASAGALFCTAGVGYAYWTTTGTGTGTATAGSAASLTSDAASVTGELYPGTSVTGSITIRNSNKFDVKITNAVFGAATHACGTTGVLFSAVTPPTAAAPLVVPKEGAVALTYRAAMDNTSSNTCQGATFTSAVTLNGQS